MAATNSYFEQSYGSENSSSEKDVDIIEKIIIDDEVEMNVTLSEEFKEPIKEISSNVVETESRMIGEVYTFKCVFCDQTLSGNDSPKLLECLHNGCSNCISLKLFDMSNDSISESGKTHIGCPICKILSDSSKIIENQFLLDNANEDESTTSIDNKCSSCSDDAVASSWCVDCSEYICDNCVQAHQRLKITKDHTIKPKEERAGGVQSPTNSNPTNLYCLVHPHEKLSLFCETCDKLTCRDCQLTDHREHKYKFTNEIASETRKSISDMLKDVGYKRVLLNSALKVIDERQTMITEKKQCLVNEITQLVVKLTNSINIRGKQLIAKLNEICEAKQKTLSEKKQALDQLSMMTDYCIKFTEHALDNGSDMALLYSKRQVNDHLKRIKSKRADIPNPELPVRIYLSLEKVPELIKAISTIGQIVVDGRVYPSPSISPATSHQSRHSSPSPNLNNGLPQSLSPAISPLQQQVSTAYRQPSIGNNSNGYQSQQQRLPPPYGQHFSLNSNNNTNINNQFQQQSNIVSNVNMRPPQQQQQQPMNISTMPSMPMSGSQQQFNNSPMRMQVQRQIAGMMTGIRINNQQQVSSSTHPQALLQDSSNLRCLLQPKNNNPVYVQTGPRQYQAIQPNIVSQQQFQQRYPNNNMQQNQMQHQQQQVSNLSYRPPRLQTMNQPQQQSQLRFPMLHQQQQQQQQQQHAAQQQQQQRQQSHQLYGGSARWHIPQSTMQNSFVNNRNTSMPLINDNFKITLKQQQPNLPLSTVTSTNPKTPSPNHFINNNNNTNTNNIKSDSERNLDKYCEESVKDLMATIAKLDSNGVQVVAETRQKGGGRSPQVVVDSSTGDAGTSEKQKTDGLDGDKDDPNEDWCAVCMDGGELVCCDKCPKVFHQYCHIPNLTVEENGTWQCLLCTNFATDFSDYIAYKQKRGELNCKHQKIIERIVLEMYCQYDPSLPFREIIGPENIDYHTVIKNPIALDTIRQKLNWHSADHYTNIEQFVKDVRLMFRNAYTYNPEDSQIYKDAKTLETFFYEQMEKFLPGFVQQVINSNEAEDEMHPPNRKYRRIIND